MDDRQTKIREGAGLEDSRVNQEFIDFLSKWSTPFCVLLLVAAGVYWGLNVLERNRVARIDQAFSDYEAVIADGNPSPNSLRSIASDAQDKGARSVPEMARLREVDLYLGAVAIGLEPGAQLNPETRDVADEADIIDDEARERYLALAESTAKQVLASTEGDADKAVLTMQALSRLASVEESRDAYDAARAYYERLGTLAESESFPSIKTFADERIAGLDALAGVGELPTNAQVPPIGGAASVPALPLDLEEQIPAETDMGTETSGEPASDDEDAQAEPETQPETDTPDSP